MPLLTDLPLEIIYHILGYVDPQDLGRIPRTCKSFYHAVNANSTLFKQVYLHHLDAPSRGPIDWERSLKDLVRLRALCDPSFDAHDKVRTYTVGPTKVAPSLVELLWRPAHARQKDELDFVHETVTELLKHASTDGMRPGSTALPLSRNADILTNIFSDESNQFDFLCRSFIYERARAEFHSKDIRYWHGPPKPEHQKSAHLHCLYGVPLLHAYPSTRRQTRQNLMHPFASSKVYDLRQYSEKNKWGPFMDDGTMRIDWEKVEAIMIVLGANMNSLDIPSRMPMCETYCSVPFAGTWPNSWKPPHGVLPPREPEALEKLDPYGITGVWLRVVCFLDYTDFFAYNFGAEEQPPPHVPRPSISVGQATRLIMMQIFVTSIENPGPEDGQGLPVVHFKGISRSLDQGFDENADSDLRGSTVLVRGTVRLTPEGEVRWTTFSIFGGIERWRSESIQVGGVRSAKGVLGHWFDKDFDPRGPAGPTAFWKVSENRSRNVGAVSSLFAEVDGVNGDSESQNREEEDDSDTDEDEVFFGGPSVIID
ncbi:hypothetical protein GQX73_g4067 [Xylaria multiplex]|uniref:F-box domain-containing protein n=1 Tax=Xylaria multiplex TaxID=323545 RepID=A0A7C8J2Q2_9PEZI|nr:hypothetical protein GQX73_g4067 [Xylaria multiplex]